MSLQVSLFLNYVRERDEDLAHRPILIICSTINAIYWSRIGKKINGRYFRTCRLTGSSADRLRLQRKFRESQPHCTITTLNIANAEIDFLKDNVWSFVVVDFDETQDYDCDVAKKLLSKLKHYYKVYLFGFLIY